MQYIHFYSFEKNEKKGWNFNGNQGWFNLMQKNLLDVSLWKFAQWQNYTFAFFILALKPQKVLVWHFAMKFFIMFFSVMYAKSICFGLLLDYVQIFGH
jgi:hypothetical protein